MEDRAQKDIPQNVVDQSQAGVGLSCTSILCHSLVVQAHLLDNWDQEKDQ